MASDERNFRSTYYEKVGCRSVEEKKSLEMLLRDKTLDRVKLKQFCLRFTVPGIYRSLVWKLLLDVIPVHVDSHEFVMQQRRMVYNDLLHALQVMRIVDSNTPKPQLLLAMWLLETGKLRYDVNIHIENNFVLIVQSLFQTFDNDTDVYWLAKGFYNYVQQFQKDFSKFRERTLNMLEKEDSILYNHLNKTDVLKSIPLEDWFESCYANIFHETALGRIWDKLCGESYKILIFVAIVLLTTLRHKLLKCTNITTVLQCVKTITEETADVIANKAIELWQHGSALTKHDTAHPAKQKI